MYVSSIGETRTYYGYALLELDAMSALSDVTVWLAADGHNAEAAAAWSDPKCNWNMNNAYDILVSEDGVNWTLMGEYDDMCGDGTNKGAGFPGRFDDDYAMKTVDDYLRLGHKAYLGGIEAKYVAVAVKECINETGNQIVIGELTVTGLVSSESTEKTPAEIYAEAEDGDLLKAINFNEAYWSDDYFNSNSWNTYYIVTDNGNAVKQSIHTKYLFGANSKRAIWGGLIADEWFPIVNDSADSDNCYTVYFDLKFGNDNENVGFGIQVDGNNSLVIDGAGNSYWYSWTTQRVGAPTDPNEMWTNKTGRDKTDKQTFAIEVNANTEEMILYVADSDGLFNKVRTLTYEAGVDVDGEGNETPYDAAWINYNLTCGIYVMNMGGTVLDRSTEISNLRIYKGLSAGYIRNSVGASVRIDEPTGIRFKSQFSKELIDSLKETYGADKVKLGMIITPTDYLANNDVEFTMAALDACGAITGAKYVKITASAIHENDMFYVIHCALVNVQTGNYNRDFSARAFIEVNGAVYKYAEFDMEDNSRSIATVAERAYNDVKGTQSDAYKNEIMLDSGATAYSPYDTEDRAILKKFFKDYAAPSITVMTYNIRMCDVTESGFFNKTYTADWGVRNPVNALKTIMQVQPDVVGLQEDDGFLYDEYSKVDGLTSTYTRLSEGGTGNGKDGDSGEGNEIMYKTSKFTASGTGVVYFKDIKGTYASYLDGILTKYSIDTEYTIDTLFNKDTMGPNDEGRFFRWVILTDKSTGEQFLVVNTHLHYRENSSDDTSTAPNKALREVQATLLRAWLLESTQGKSCSNRIVMGDLNSVETATEFAGLTTGDGALDQARNDASYKADTYGTLIVNTESDTENYFKTRQEWVFDHILYNGDVLTAAEYSVIDNKNDQNNTAYPSDHLPVVAKFICK